MQQINKLPDVLVVRSSYDLKLPVALPEHSV